MLPAWNSGKTYSLRPGVAESHQHFINSEVYWTSLPWNTSGKIHTQNLSWNCNVCSVSVTNVVALWQWSQNKNALKYSLSSMQVVQGCSCVCLKLCPTGLIRLKLAGSLKLVFQRIVSSNQLLCFSAPLTNPICLCRSLDSRSNHVVPTYKQGQPCIPYRWQWAQSTIHFTPALEECP